MSKPTCDPKATILAALANYCGDNYSRAKSAFKDLSEEALDQEYGCSGQTPRQILAGYARHQECVDRAVDWVNQS